MTPKAGKGAKVMTVAPPNIEKGRVPGRHFVKQVEHDLRRVGGPSQNVIFISIFHSPFGMTGHAATPSDPPAPVPRELPPELEVSVHAISRVSIDINVVLFGMFLFR